MLSLKKHFGKFVAGLGGVRDLKLWSRNLFWRRAQRAIASAMKATT
jgi:hypothetical protein